jgi:hypothetical protein
MSIIVAYMCYFRDAVERLDNTIVQFYGLWTSITEFKSFKYTTDTDNTFLRRSLRKGETLRRTSTRPSDRIFRLLFDSNKTKIYDTVMCI